MGFPGYFTAYGGEPPPRTGASHATIVPYGPFKAGDGKTVFLSIQNEREFERFCAIVLENGDLALDPRFSTGPSRTKNRNAMHEEIERIFSKLSAEDILARLEAAGIANAKLNSMQEFWDHPQLEARDRWREVGSPAGPLEAMKPPFNIDGFEPRMDAIPALGAHNRAILAELGFDAAEIQAMAKANIIEEETS
jgi:crotonobetainyl-CoA:carnitine CoA-transferase CaiB-like acyl-CoA transferase